MAIANRRQSDDHLLRRTAGPYMWVRSQHSGVVPHVPIVSENGQLWIYEFTP
jgi:hypothetical protein